MPQAASWSGMPTIKGGTETTRMALLTFSLIGLQFTWGIEMTYCTPYLLSLGLSKTRTSAVWIAGPLSGLIVQPIVGVIADNSKSKWGRRRPFMIVGSFVVFACLLAMGWAAEIVERFVSHPESRPFWNICVAVGSIYATDFAINAVQCCCRSLIVDTLPIQKQQIGNAWASRMAAIGHLIGYAIGTINLRNLWGDWLGDTQFKQLCVIAGLALIFACAVTSYAVTERILISSKDADKAQGAIATIARLFRMTMHLPPRIQAICWVQFWGWIGWFPFLFYSPTWVGETYFRYSAPADLPKSTDRLGEIGRIGSLCLVIFSAITFAASVVFPFLISSPTSSTQPERTRNRRRTNSDRRRFTPRPHPALAPFVGAIERFQERRPDLLTAWMAANLAFGAIMLAAPLVRSIGAATFLVSLCGLPWAIACWAPFAFMGVEVNRMSTPSLSRGNMHVRSASLAGATSLPAGPPFPRPSFDEASPPGTPTMLRLHHQPGVLERFDSDGEDAGEEVELMAVTGRGGAAEEKVAIGSTGETAGIYLGVLNVFTTLPQFVGTFISMIVFAVFEPGASRELSGAADNVADADAASELGQRKEGVNAIAVCLFIGGLCALGSAYATRNLRHVRETSRD